MRALVFIALVHSAFCFGGDLPELGARRRRPATTYSAPGSLSLSQFQLGSVGAFQDSGGSSFAPELSWNPTLKLARPVDLRGNFGVMAFRTSGAGDIFPATEYELLITAFFGPVLIEAGGGFQSWWHTGGGTFPTVLGNVGVKFHRRLLGFIERFYTGGALVMATGDTTRELRLGLGIML